jgi:hypothetical protein
MAGRVLLLMDLKGTSFRGVFESVKKCTLFETADPPHRVRRLALPSKPPSLPHMLCASLIRGCLPLGANNNCSDALRASTYTRNAHACANTHTPPGTRTNIHTYTHSVIHTQ